MSAASSDAGLSPELTAAFVGFGEVGGLLAQGLVLRGVKVRVFDLVFQSTDKQGLTDKAASLNVVACNSMSAAVAGAHVVISAVTPAASMRVAGDAGQLMKAGQVFLDLNSVSPETKRTDQRLVEVNGADYIEAALMAPVRQLGIKVPMLLGGRRCNEVATLLTALGMKARAVSQEVGVVSAIKMCRSVMIMGIEALMVECMAAGRHYGAEDQVLESLNEAFPGMGWTEQLPHLMISQVADEGERQAIELRQVAQTMRDAGVPPHMAEAAARVQEALPRAMRDRGISAGTDRPFDWTRLIDRLDQKD